MMQTIKGTIYFYNNVAYFKPDPNVSFNVFELQTVLNDLETTEIIAELDNGQSD